MEERQKESVLKDDGFRARVDAPDSACKAAIPEEIQLCRGGGLLTLAANLTLEVSNADKWPKNKGQRGPSIVGDCPVPTCSKTGAI